MGWGAILSSAIGANASTENTNSTNYMNRQIARETNEANAALAKQQNDWNVDMWNRTNEYNSPSNQIALLRAAGLNPNLYRPEGMTAASLTSADLANQQVGNPMVSNGSDLINAAIAAGNSMDNDLNRIIQRKKADAEINHLQEQDKEIKQNVEVLKSQYKLNDQLAEKAAKDIDLSNEKMRQIRQDIFESYSRERLNDASIRKLSFDQWMGRLQYNLNRRMTDASIKKIFKDMEVSDATIVKLDQEANRLVKECIKLGRDIEISDIDIFIKSVEADYKRELTDLEKQKIISDIYNATTSSAAKYIQDFNQALGLGYNKTNSNPYYKPYHDNSGAFTYSNGNSRFYRDFLK